MDAILTAIINEIKSVAENVNEERLDSVVEAITYAPRIFVAGAGRSGLMAKAFAMRLMHAGLDANVIGEITTSSSRQGDLLVLATGSGETESLKAYAQKAKKNGLKIVAITSFPESTLGTMADIVLQIPAPTPKSDKQSSISSKQPMGSLFEQTLLLSFDTLVIKTMKALNLESDEMFKNHANLE
ncbi:6-phospho-3-hexuloisomerase [Planomicrobium sp. CPCC 101110]|uniref:6-phospho-3-hexuloisomerase n=1 Tax=Planomicrobium sp. CPCC 101110 TaxID=2599619 RepID=UPI0011B3834B|nr:6-phospho-3-hexuloisomerase [Planomicrobium sp. CPCC 101110]TWT25421.1 6-phospho-3-hexuloisomerase [Planomicrobium sp. CPCC 101110]